MQNHRDVLLSVIYQQALILIIKKITVQEQIRRIHAEYKNYAASNCNHVFQTILMLKKDPYSCYGFEWEQCEDSPLDILDESNCPIIEAQVPIESNPVRIELDDSLLDRFNELSEEELKDLFGIFTPVQSLNPYMTKLSTCSIKKEGVFIITNRFL